MSYCQPNAHARQTILRGCCTTGNNCCNIPSGYDARKYCYCSDISGNNTQGTFAGALCSALIGVTGSHVGYTGFYTSLEDDIKYNRFTCGLLHIGVTGVTGTIVAEVENGVVTVTGPALPVGNYSVYVEENAPGVCARVTLTN